MEPGVSFAVWVTRPEEGAARTGQALRAAGFTPQLFPLLQVDMLTPQLPEDPPDVVVFVSANAVRALGETGPVLAEARRRARTVCVGRKTADAAREAGWDVAPLAGAERASGMLRGMQGWQLSQRRVWIPRGNRDGSARREIPRFLEEAGAIVVPIDVYRVGRRKLPEAELQALRETPPRAVLVHSPSAATVLFRGAQARQFRDVVARAACVAIGPTTAARLGELGADPIRRAARPEDSAILAVLDQLAKESVQ